MTHTSASTCNTDSLFGATVQFTPEELHNDNAYLVIYMSDPDADVDIILKEFTFLLPGVDSYPNPADACPDLAIGGDAYLNGFATFPTRTNTNLLKLFKVEEEVNDKGSLYFGPPEAPSDHILYDGADFNGGYQITPDGKQIGLWGNTLVQFDLSSLMDEENLF
eukprot:7731569-Ditylum_brightwellii.AAC.1